MLGPRYYSPFYQGSVADVPAYFAERGRPSPPNFNPADWIMSVAQSVPVDQLDADGFFPKDEREIGEAFEAEDGKDILGMTNTRRGIRADDLRADDRSPGIATQVSMLFTRELVNIKRDVTPLIARFGLTTFLGILVGIIFLDVGQESRGKELALIRHPTCLCRHPTKFLIYLNGWQIILAMSRVNSVL